MEKGFLDLRTWHGEFKDTGRYNGTSDLFQLCFSTMSDSRRKRNESYLLREVLL